MICELCPRRCGAERRGDGVGNGYCGAPEMPVIARAALHYGEEPCISSENGSGTVFFSGCSLSCVFCQNYEISHNMRGKSVSVKRLAEIFKELYEAGADNINLVNPTHYVSAIAEAFEIYKPPIPVVYNSGGYDSKEVLNKVSFADVFLLDLKYLDRKRALKYSNAEDYPSIATEAILECARRVGGNVFDDRGLMKKGLIIRHLIMPQGTNEALGVIDWVKKNVPWAVLSLMSQYTPCGDLSKFPEIDRRITRREYGKVLDYAAESGIENIYTQKLSSFGEEFIPPFDLTGV